MLFSFKQRVFMSTHFAYSFVLDISWLLWVPRIAHSLLQQPQLTTVPARTPSVCISFKTPHAHRNVQYFLYPLFFLVKAIAVSLPNVFPLSIVMIVKGPHRGTSIATWPPVRDFNIYKRVARWSPTRGHIYISTSRKPLSTAPAYS